MSNVNWIGRKTEHGAYYVYCHWGGDLDVNGRILQEHYTNEEKVKRLLDHGDIRYIEKTIDKCEFYAQMTDRNESPRPPTTELDAGGRPVSADTNALCFLWRNNKWYVSSGDRIRDWWVLGDLVGDRERERNWEKEIRGVEFNE